MSPFSQKSKSIVPSTSKRVFERIPPSVPISGLSGAPAFSEGAVFSLMSLFTEELSPFVVDVTSEMRKQNTLTERNSYANKIPYSPILCNLLTVFNQSREIQMKKAWWPRWMTQAMLHCTSSNMAAMTS